MTTTIEQVAGMTRGLLSGALNNEVTRLATAYNPGDPTISLLHDKRVGEGSVLSIGLNTFVAATSTTGREVSVVPGLDGSPDVSQPAGSTVFVRPRHTNWQIVSNLTLTISSLSSAKHGLYQMKTEEFPSDPTWNTYVLASDPLKVHRVRYRVIGSPDQWANSAFEERSTPDGNVVYAPQVPGGTTVEVRYGADFSVPESLDDTLEDLGMPDTYAQMLAVGAARGLALASESRRNQPFSQGDPRRAEEVPMTGNVVVYDRLQRWFRDLVAEERARLVQDNSYRIKMEAFR